MLTSPHRDIFLSRSNLKPYEYPELYEYTDAVRHSYWVHTEFNFTGDVQDFHVNVTESEREAIRRTMLAIAQIEVAVKSFWGDVGKHLPKPEIAAVGTTFAESEVRHCDAYAHLIEILGFNEEFESLLEVPVLRDRYAYLSETAAMGRSSDPREYTKAMILFSLLIEHVSLFSQFLIMMSFNKYKNVFKGISNAVEATSKEENIHGMFGIDIVNIIRRENPEWFDESTNKMIENFCRDAYEAEEAVVDWIFEKGELEFLPKSTIKEFIKNRINRSIKAAGFSPVFDVDDSLLEDTEWFDNEVIATKHVDFFDKRSINYNKKSKPVTAEDLFGV